MKYKAAFTFNITPEWLNSDYPIGFSSLIDNFLPANILLFNILSNLRNQIGDFYIKTREVEKLFNFDKKVDFINFMYSTWEDLIDNTYKYLGAILIKPDRYYKFRGKLNKRFYQRFPL